MLMDEDKTEGISTYRMNQLMKTAASITELLVAGKHLYNPSYRECELVIEFVSEAIKKSKNENRRNNNVSE